MKIDFKPLVRFFEHLPAGGDIELSLLKCHLLCEEVLNKAIERHLKAPEHFAKARITFAHKICIAHSLYREASYNWLWPALEKLNAARNELAHGLSNSALNTKVETFYKLVQQSQGPSPDTVTSLAVFGPFQWAVFQVFSQLAGFANYDPTTIKSDRMSLLAIASRSKT